MKVIVNDNLYYFIDWKHINPSIDLKKAEENEEKPKKSKIKEGDINCV